MAAEFSGCDASSGAACSVALYTHTHARGRCVERGWGYCSASSRVEADSSAVHGEKCGSGASHPSLAAEGAFSFCRGGGAVRRNKWSAAANQHAADDGLRIPDRSDGSSMGPGADRGRRRRGEEVRRQREDGRRRGEGKLCLEGIWWQTAVGDSRPVWMTPQSAHMPDRCPGATNTGT